MDGAPERSREEIRGLHVGPRGPFTIARRRVQVRQAREHPNRPAGLAGRTQHHRQRLERSSATGIQPQRSLQVRARFVGRAQAFGDLSPQPSQDTSTVGRRVGIGQRSGEQPLEVRPPAEIQSEGEQALGDRAVAGSQPGHRPEQGIGPRRVTAPAELGRVREGRRLNARIRLHRSHRFERFRRSRRFA